MEGWIVLMMLAMGILFVTIIGMCTYRVFMDYFF